MPVSLGKVQKRIGKKKTKEAGSLHPLGRDTRLLHRASAREEKLSKAASAGSRARQVYLDRVKFIQENIPDTQASISAQQCVHAVQTYINRHDAEVQELESQRRKNRPIPKRLEVLRDLKEGEMTEFHNHGFYVPDATTEENRERLKKWNGEWSALTAVTFARVKTDGEMVKRPFPPKGAS